MDPGRVTQMNKKLLMPALLTLLLALFVSSCSKTPENLASREVIDGIEYVHNAAVPAHPDVRLSLEEELSIGGEDDEGNIILYEAGNVIVDEAEDIYIVDRQDFQIKVFSPEGSFIRSIGKQGEGPGEFQAIGYVTFVPDGRLLVMDFRSRRTSLFDIAGNFISGHPWTKSFSQLVLPTNSSYFVQEFIIEEGSDPLSERRLVLDEVDFEGNQIRSFGEYKMAELRVLTQGNIMFGMSVPHSPQSLFAGDMSNQYLYHCLNDTYLIDVLDTQGTIFRKIELPYDPLPYTSHDKEQFLDRYREREDENQLKLVEGMDFPSEKNVMARMMTDDEGNLWVQTHEIREDGDTKTTAYDIFNGDGTYDMKVWLEMRPDVIKKGRMYIHYADEDTGFTYIKRFRMIWSE
jgi:hypothetical protein